MQQRPMAHPLSIFDLSPVSTNMTAGKALNNSLELAAAGAELPEMLDDLYAFAGGGFPKEHPLQNVAAVPMGVALPPVWLIGSSDNAHGSPDRGVSANRGFTAHSPQRDRCTPRSDQGRGDHGHVNGP